MKPSADNRTKLALTAVALVFATILTPQITAQTLGDPTNKSSDGDTPFAKTSSPLPTNSNPIPYDQIGAVAGKQYLGDGLSVVATKDSAALRCVFQRLDGEATQDGLWLKSTVPDRADDRFRVKAVAVGEQPLPDQGDVSLAGGIVRFSRLGLVEEYSVSMDGVRQDFLVLEKPGSSGRESAPSKAGPGKSEPAHGGCYKREGELRVNLAVSGAKVEQTVAGAQLVLENSGRKIAYSRLKVTDANGRELPARIEVTSNSALRTPHSEFAMAVVVNDTDGAYPIRIDPTFSDANWLSMGGIFGANNTVRAIAVDGAGNLYIGGDFTAAGETNASRIAKWDGSAWVPVGLGLNGSVLALAASGIDLYAGGAFSIATNGGGSLTVNRIAKWNGSVWSALGSGLNNSVLALSVSDTNVYVGGSFTTAGGSAANRIAKWNGSSWSALGSGMDNTVWSLAVSDTNVYGGGVFTTAGGIAANRIAKWNGSSWSALGSGMNNLVGALAVLGTNVYAGGTFTNAGGAAANYIAKWNGSGWSTLGAGMNGNVIALTVSGSNVYAGGAFTTAGGNSAYYIAKWDGSTWSSVGTGTGSYVYALTASGSNVYAGGEFTSAGVNQAYRVAKWDGSNWGVLGTGNQVIYALAIMGGDIYAGGAFTASGGGVANSVARWNGNAWTGLGSGMDGSVGSLAVLGSNLYAGGQFTNASGITANRVAKWDGSNWTSLGSGMNSWVSSLMASGSNLYVGGAFSTAGGVSASGVAKWDGIGWSALGTGRFGARCFAMHGTNLYVGSYYVTSDGFGGTIPVGKVARWDGSNWTELGSGMDHGVIALAVSGSNVYAGGYFTIAGGYGANRIAKWTGSRWSALGSGLNGYVNALAVSESDLYVGGQFTTADGSAANYIAKWNGSSWSALGSGMNEWVYALAVSGSDLYAGGRFTAAGGKLTGHIARTMLPSDLPQITDQPDSLTVSSTATAGFGIVAIGAEPLIYRWRKNGTDLLNGGNITGATTTNLTISNVQSADAGNYRVVVSNAYGSVTSSVAILSVSLPGELVTLGDYFPLPLNANWLYDGTDWDGAPAKTRNHVASVNTNITLYTGRSPAVAYTTNCIQMAAAYLDRTTLVAYDTWEDYLAIGGRFGQFGDDDLPSESLRVDGGVIFPAQMAVGGSATYMADAYLFGTFAGVMTNVLQVLERTSLTVPAGYFPDVLHVRRTIRFPGGTQVQEQWWARSVGKIKRQGISGGGAAHHFELIDYSVPVPPAILVNDGSMGFVSNKFGFKISGQTGQAVAVDASTNLLNWLPLQTNTFGTGAFYFSDPIPPNLPRRFYRVRAL